MNSKDSEFGSDGFTSETGSSQLTAEMDTQLKQYGELNINMLILQKTPQFLLTELLPVMYRICEFLFVATFVDYENLLKMIEVGPFIDAFSINLQAGIGTACASLANKNILQQQFVAATIYYAYYYIACLIFDVVSIVVGMAGVSLLYSTSASQIYIIVSFCIVPFINTFGQAQYAFWKVENRHALILITECVSFVVKIVIMLFLFLNFKSLGVELTLSCLAGAQLAAGIIQIIWSVFITSRKSFLNVKYKGILKFTFKRLSPFRVRFLGHVIGKSLPCMIINVTPQILYIVCIVLTKFSNLDTARQETKMFRVEIIWITYGIFTAIHRSLADIFDILINYNLTQKKFKRIIKIIISILVYDIVLGAVIAIIFFFISKLYLQSLLPAYIKGLVSAQYQIDNTVNAVQYCSLASIVFVWQLLATTLLQLENRNVASALLQLPKIIFSVASPFILDALVGQNSPHYVLIALSDCISGVVSINMIIYYIARYQKLAKMEIRNEEQIQRQKELIEKAKAEGRDYNEMDNDQAADLRKTISAILEDKIQIDDGAHSSMQRHSTSFADKNVLLRNSVSFNNMKQQFRQSESNHESTNLRGSNYGTNRDSQFLLQNVASINIRTSSEQK